MARIGVGRVGIGARTGILAIHYRLRLRELDQRAVAHPDEIQFTGGLKGVDRFL